jgi:hypothetical protein
MILANVKGQIAKATAMIHHLPLFSWSELAWLCLSRGTCSKSLIEEICDVRRKAAPNRGPDLWQGKRGGI